MQIFKYIFISIAPKKYIQTLILFIVYDGTH